MGANRSKAVNRPFGDLDARLKRHKISLAPDSSGRPAQAPDPLPAETDNDEDLFQKTMADVKPMRFNNLDKISQP